MTKAQEFRDQSAEELEARYDELSRRLFELRCEEKATGKIEKPSEVRTTRRDIARLLTIVNEKKK